MTYALLSSRCFRRCSSVVTMVRLPSTVASMAPPTGDRRTPRRTAPAPETPRHLTSWTPGSTVRRTVPSTSTPRPTPAMGSTTTETKPPTRGALACWAARRVARRPAARPGDEPAGGAAPGHAASRRRRPVMAPTRTATGASTRTSNAPAGRGALAETGVVPRGCSSATFAAAGALAEGSTCPAKRAVPKIRQCAWRHLRARSISTWMGSWTRGASRRPPW